MTDTFRDRADLQRRQIYHQQLLDSQRFGADGAQNGAGPISSAGGGSGEGAWLGTALLVLSIVALPVTLFAVLAAFPLVLLILFADRALSGYWAVGVREAFVASALATFVYLMTTGVIAIVAYGLGAIGDDWNRLLHWPTLTALQLPGLLLGTAVLCWRIESPFSGVKGCSIALTASALAMPLGAGFVLWIVTRWM